MGRFHGYSGCIGTTYPHEKFSFSISKPISRTWFVEFGQCNSPLASVLGPNSGYESNMPAYKGVLIDEEIVAVLSYIKSRWPQEVRVRHDAINARAGQ